MNILPPQKNCLVITKFPKLSTKCFRSSQEMTIPISFGEMPKMARTPKPRLMPFAFPSLPEFGEPLQMPSIAMPSATDMMAQMQAQMQAQMAQMQQMQMPAMMNLSMPNFPSGPQMMLQGKQFKDFSMHDLIF